MAKPNTKLSPADAFFLNSCLPDRELKQQWRPLFNSAQDGESFSKFQAALTNGKASRTPTFVIVWEDGEDGHVFGGYGSHPWAIGPKFFGDNTYPAGAKSSYLSVLNCIRTKACLRWQSQLGRTLEKVT